MGKVRKNVTIRSDQESWLEDRDFNLSEFLRDRLDEEIENRS